MNRSRSRFPSSSERRAGAWINQHQARAADSEDLPTSRPGIFTVQRAMRPLEGGLSRQSRLLKLVEATRNVTPVRFVSVSVIMPHEGLSLTRRWQEADEDKLFKIEEAAETCQPKLEGFLGRAVVGGAKRNQPGKRYLAVSLDYDDDVTVNLDRSRLFEAADHDDYREISAKAILGVSTDQAAVDALLPELNGELKNCIAYEFGEVEVLRPLGLDTLSRVMAG